MIQANGGLTNLRNTFYKRNLDAVVRLVDTRAVVAQENAMVHAYVNLVVLALELGAAVDAVLVLGGLVREKFCKNFFLKAHLGFTSALSWATLVTEGLRRGDLPLMV